jgi:hypothetical protein
VGDESLRNFGMTPEFGQEIRKAGDWLEAQLDALGFSKEEINSALEELALRACLGRIMDFEDEKPEALAKKIRSSMIEKRSKRQKKA